MGICRDGGVQIDRWNMLLDVRLFFYEKFEKKEQPGQGCNIPIERHFPEGVGQTVHGIVQLVHQVAVDKGSVADHRNSFACECLRSLYYHLNARLLQASGLFFVHVLSRRV